MANKVRSKPKHMQSY